MNLDDFDSDPTAYGGSFADGGTDDFDPDRAPFDGEFDADFDGNLDDPTGADDAGRSLSNVTAERHHWLNTLVGLVDSAFSLTDEEQFHCSRIVGWLLEQLRIPERGVPQELPMPLVLEISSGFYTLNLTSRIDSGVLRPARSVGEGDYVVPLELWRSALVRMLTTSYPDISPTERVLASKTFDDLLGGLGVPHRAAAFVPEDVVRAIRTELG